VEEGKGRNAAVQRPEANEGGREEEERRFGIVVGGADSLHGRLNRSFNSRSFATP
jgi:hypothetical protein